ncbi:MAG: hypothetical protein WC176_08305, partial [Candidatus Cloacimonadaceae bacterium]
CDEGCFAVFIAHPAWGERSGLGFLLYSFLHPFFDNYSLILPILGHCNGQNRDTHQLKLIERPSEDSVTG